MDFTEIYRQSASLVAFSPGTHFILTAVQDRVIIRRSDTFQVTRTWQIESSPSPTNQLLAPDSKKSSELNHHLVTHLGWSCDSQYILAACAKRAVVHIFKLEDEAWSARIDGGVEGALSAEGYDPVLKHLLSRLG
jgi:hypothetical protein